MRDLKGIGSTRGATGRLARSRKHKRSSSLFSLVVWCWLGLTALLVLEGVLAGRR